MVPSTPARTQPAADRDRPAVSVILIREYAEQLTGSGCCGKLEGDNALLGGDGLFAHTRRHQRDLGVLHRAIRDFFPLRDGQSAVSVVTVDPRNQLYLIAKLWADVWTYRPGLGRGLQSGLQMFSLPAVIINGRVVSDRVVSDRVVSDRVVSGRRGPPDPDSVCHQIHQLLEVDTQVRDFKQRQRNRPSAEESPQ